MTTINLDWNKTTDPDFSADDQAAGGSQADLLAETDAMIADARAGMDDECRTALAIDRNDAWCDIAAAARMDGFEELASALEAADAEWES